ncbi:hypothetical protein RHGRI_012692 [Rhododendron griersonianum]|uniref:Secreted protein n=1 Tax=Rhododendron griersonianum TaxID=479676 RepID=A0AAV6KSH8_9ERIC|nr:hypothetical protein RHGRI_012692 [Rhododendron griersonianum]
MNAYNFSKLDALAPSIVSSLLFLRLCHWSLGKAPNSTLAVGAPESPLNRSGRHFFVQAPVVPTHVEPVTVNATCTAVLMLNSSLESF